MVDRPPVRLLTRLPEGNANGFALEVDRLVDRGGPAEPEGYALIRYVSPKIDVNRETGVDTAVIRIVEVEPLLAGRMPTDYDYAGEALQAIRGDRTGTARLPEQDATEWARLVELRRQLDVYRNREEITSTELSAKILDTIPGAGPGWRDDPRIISEFLQNIAELDEDALAHAGELEPEPAPDDPAGDEPERDVDGPPDDSPEPHDTVKGKPCPDWTAHVEHGPHGWIHEDDGQVYCPGWDHDPDVTPKGNGGRGKLAAVPEATFTGG